MKKTQLKIFSYKTILFMAIIAAISILIRNYIINEKPEEIRDLILQWISYSCGAIFALWLVARLADNDDDSQ